MAWVLDWIKRRKGCWTAAVTSLGILTVKACDHPQAPAAHGFQAAMDCHLETSTFSCLFRVFYHNNRKSKIRGFLSAPQSFYKYTCALYTSFLSPKNVHFQLMYSFRGLFPEYEPGPEARTSHVSNTLKINQNKLQVNQNTNTINSVT